jgi:hypothetical protein
VYARTLHHNLTFNRNDMRKAIGTSIRSATCELRKLERLRRQQLNAIQNENEDPDERNESTNATEASLNETHDITDGDEEKDEDDDGGEDDGEEEDENGIENEDEDGIENEDEDGIENEGEDEDSDDDKQADDLMIDEALDENDE